MGMGLDYSEVVISQSMRANQAGMGCLDRLGRIHQFCSSANYTIYEAAYSVNLLRISYMSTPLRFSKLEIILMAINERTSG
jgi:hypothetical protein